MTTPQGRRPTTSGASAGIFILSAVLICTALGLGVGTLLGSAVAGGVTGVMVGFATGIALVIVRFKDL
ncbi:MAG: hypothetical protein NTX07_03320 [Solirubrobacterales bacterium]|nr:hypothetical protein [Solirubrobacterales bacterium]